MIKFIQTVGSLSFPISSPKIISIHFTFVYYNYYYCKNVPIKPYTYTLSEAWGGVNWADLMAAQGAFGTDFNDRSTRTIVGTMLWTVYRPVIKIGPKGALGSHEIRPIHSAPSLGQSIPTHAGGTKMHVEKYHLYWQCLSSLIKLINLL